MLGVAGQVLLTASQVVRRTGVAARRAIDQGGEIGEGRHDMGVTARSPRKSQIGSRRVEALRVVARVADEHVARMAQHTPDLARLMVVVDHQIAVVPATRLQHAPTDGAAALPHLDRLLLRDPVLAYVVPGQHSGLLLGVDVVCVLLALARTEPAALVRVILGPRLLGRERDAALDAGALWQGIRLAVGLALALAPGFQVASLRAVHGPRVGGREQCPAMGAWLGGVSLLGLRLAVGFVVVLRAEPFAVQGQVAFFVAACFHTANLPLF